MQKIITLSFITNLILVAILSLLYLSKAPEILAQDPYPVPSPDIPCNATDSPEFNSLRPYQASPCYDKKDDLALFCGNTLFLPFPVDAAYHDASMQYCDPPSGNNLRCYFEKQVNISELEISMTGVQLPIMGNTEDVPNSTQETSLPERDLVNHYVSWYLNGVTGRAEQLPLELDTTDEDDERKLTDPDERRLIEMSGPLKKLLPWDIQVLERTEQIVRTSKVEKDELTSYKQDRVIEKSGEEDQAGNDKLDRHDQIIGCVYGIRFVVWEPVLAWPPWQKRDVTLGDIPTPCYGDGPLDNLKVKVRLSDYVEFNHMPPLRDEYEDDDLATYLEHYKEWRGNFCTVIEIPELFIIPVPSALKGKKILLCFDDPTNLLLPKYYANLWDNIPFSTTEDRLGEIEITSSSVQPASSDMTVSNVVIETAPADLFFPHMQEVDELTDTLQDTYVAQDVLDLKATPAKDSKVSGLYCDIANVRTNKGDYLFPTSDGDWKGGMVINELEFLASFPCDFSIEYDEFDNMYITNPSCSKTAIVSLDTTTKTPLANEVWARLVEGDQSVFKRFYPKVGEGSPVDEILDIPASSTVTYERSDGGTINVRGPDGSTSSPEIYFPHIGGIYEYFLMGIQTALRPKGMGSGPLSGNLIDPGTVSSSCSEGSGLCSVSALLPYFGNDMLAATKASIICNCESGSSPTAMNTGCLTGSSVDYSIGLFQINLLAHCANAFSSYTWDPPSCTVASEQRLEHCTEKFLDPVQNIEYAVGLSRNGANWSPWSCADHCGIQ